MASRGADLSQSRPEQNARESRSEQKGEMEVRDHYNARPNLGIVVRMDSRVYHLKNLNNWIKSVLIQKYVRPGDCVLDLCCGKGGDLLKWQKARVSSIVMADVALQSIKHAIERYNSSHHRPQFPAKFIAGDCFEVDLDKALDPAIQFDVVSCQFAVHYAFEDRKKVRRLLLNVSKRLKPGGVFIGTLPDANVLVRKLRNAQGLEFGNDLYRVRFDDPTKTGHWNKKFAQDDICGHRYGFYLEDAIGEGGAQTQTGELTYVPEYLVPFPQFCRLAEEHDLKLDMGSNFHKFFNENCSERIQNQLLYTIKVLNEEGTMSPQEWEIAYLYKTFAFRKKAHSDPDRPPSRQQTKFPYPHNVPVLESEIMIL